MTTTRKVAARALAALGAAALAVVTLSGVATAAPGPGQPGAPTTGSLTVNKYRGAETGTLPPAGDRLAGVEFIVTPVGRTAADGTCTAISTANTTDWQGLETLFASRPAAPAAPYCLLPARQVTQQTNAQGTTTFGSLPLGIYYVQEGRDLGNNNIVSKVQPFYVSIPMPSSGDWTYAVTVNPKNQTVNAPSKTITDRPSALTVGSTVTWNLTVPVPTLNNGETFNQAVITDQLNSALTYANSSLTLNGATLVAGTDYTLDAAGVSWTFTAAGRTKLNGAMGGTIAVSLQTTVTTVPADGTIPNSTYRSSFNGTTVPGTVVPYTYWGQLAIKKVDDSGTPIALAGAQFQVFDAANGSGQCPATAPATGAVSTGTSDAAGVVQWNATTPAGSPLGLWVANSPSGPASNPSKVYCVYETVVPAGYSARPFDNAVRVTPGTLAAGTFSRTVVNPQRQGPNLPLTGSGGTVAMTLGGLALVTGGLGTVAISRRRRRDAA